MEAKKKVGEEEKGKRKEIEEISKGEEQASSEDDECEKEPYSPIIEIEFG